MPSINFKLNPLTSNKNDAESKIDKPITGVAKNPVEHFERDEIYKE